MGETAPEESEHAWSQWWGIQNALCGEVDQRVDKAAAGRSDQFSAALVASLIEHLAEKQRVYLHLPATDSREDSDE